MNQDWEKELFNQLENSSSRENPLDDILSLDGVDDEYVQWGELILRLQDGVIEKNDFDRLEKWLLTGREALQYYIDFTSLMVGLYFLFNKKDPAQLFKKMSVV